MRRHELRATVERRRGACLVKGASLIKGACPIKGAVVRGSGPYISTLFFHLLAHALHVETFNLEVVCYAAAIASRNNSDIQSATHKCQLLKIRFCGSETFPSAHTLGYVAAGKTENDVFWGEIGLRIHWHGSHCAHW